MRHVPARPEQTQSPWSDTSSRLKREIESLEGQRADLVRALAAAEKSVRTFPAGSLAQGKARTHVTRLQNELRLIKGKLGIVKKYRDLGDFLIQICKERITQTEWRRIVAEARRRHDSQDSLKRAGTLEAGIELSRTRPAEHD